MLSEVSMTWKELARRGDDGEDGMVNQGELGESPRLEAGGVSRGILIEDSWTGGGAVSRELPGVGAGVSGVPIPTVAQDPSTSSSGRQAQWGP